jgi:hypothetical protein
MWQVSDLVALWESYERRENERGMKKFEYEFELVTVATELAPVISVGNPKERLNILGRQGWELVAVSAHGNYYCGCFFKRELDSQ